MLLPDHMHIISNGSTNVFPNNALTKFTNVLPNTFETLKNDNYRVSVESIGFSTKFGNLLKPKKNLPSVIIVNHVPECSNDGDWRDCTSKKKVSHTDAELQRCEKSLSWQMDKPGCRFKEFYLYDVFYSTEKIQEFCRNMSEGYSVKFSFDGTRMSIEHSTPPDDDDVNTITLTPTPYIFLHPTFVKTFELPTTIELTDTGLMMMEKKFPDKRLQKVLIDEFYTKDIRIKDEFYYGYRILRTNFYKPLRGLPCTHNFVRKMPRIIRVQSSIIAEQVLNGIHSKDLVVFCPDFKSTEDYYFQEFIQPQQVKLQNSVLSQIDLSLRDEDGGKLNLLSGIPTIVKLKFEKMDSNFKSFNVRLTSEVNAHHPNNQKSSFKVKLPNILYFNSKWRVALTSISHPNSYNTFTGRSNSIEKGFHFKYSPQYPNEPEHEWFLENKVYNQQELLDAINTKGLTARKWIFAEASINPDNNKLRIYPYYSGWLSIGNNVLDVLGFRDAKNKSDSFTTIELTKGQYYQFGGEINLTLLQPHIIIAYSNIVKPTIFAGEYLNVLRVLSTPKDNSFVIQEFKNKHFIELLNTQISEIEIYLRTQDGELIEFAGDKDVIVNLEFSNVD